MLVIYDDTGFVEHAIFVGDFEALKPIYEGQGKKVLDAEYVSNPGEIYVRDGKVETRPNIAIGGEIRPIKADGVDTLHLSVTPAAFSLRVELDGAVVHDEASTEGSLDFSTAHPGTYTLHFDAAFPYLTTTVVVETT